MGSKLKKLTTKSSVLEIRIKYNEEIIKFNLADELAIDENRINQELQEQPSYYGFLTLLLVKLNRVKDDKKASLERLESELFIENKSNIDTNTNRPYSNDLAMAEVKTDNKYKIALKNLHKAEENWGLIKSCVNSFDQRAYLMQSISANVRKEKDNY